MKVLLSVTAVSKLKAAGSKDRKAVKAVLRRLSASPCGIGHRLDGLDNAFQISPDSGGPVLLYEVSADGVARVLGIITSRQQQLGKFPVKVGGASVV